MDKKSNLLSSLKRQVLALKSQLERIQHHRHAKPPQQCWASKKRQSPSHSPRFDSLSLDCSYLEKGIKKFYGDKWQLKNISQLIHQKAQPQRRGVYSSQRRAENERTRLNFSSQRDQHSQTRSRSPNPLTGEGYSERRAGKRLEYPERKEAPARPCSKRHFNFYS